MSRLFSSAASAAILVAFSAPSVARQGGPLPANTIVRTTGVVQEMTTSANLVSGTRNESVGPPMSGTFRAPGTLIGNVAAESDIPGYVSINSGAANVHSNAHAIGAVLPSIVNVGTLKVFTDVGGRIAGTRNTSSAAEVKYTNEINPRRCAVGYYVRTVDAHGYEFDFGGGAPSIVGEASATVPGLGQKSWGGAGAQPVHEIKVGAQVAHLGPLCGPWPGAVPGEFTLSHSLTATANGNSRARGYIQLHVEFFVTEVWEWHPAVPPIPMIPGSGHPGYWEKL